MRLKKHRSLPERLGSRLARPLALESLEDRTLLSVNFHPLYQVAKSSGGFSPLASSSPAGYTPAQVRQAYGVNLIQFSGGIVGDGSGQTIALVDAYDDPNIQTDLDAFSTQYELPTTASGQFSFSKVNQIGGNSFPAANASWAVEESLDVEWAHAIAPKANLILVEANDSSGNNIFSAVSYAASLPAVSVVSMSFGGSEWSSETSLDGTDFVTPAGHTNVSFVASSGDAGAPPEYPSASPNVLAVGGTALYLDDSNNYQSETAWGDSGGGVSAYEAQPAYQNGIVTQSSTQRTTPDVSYDANPGTGFPVYDSYTYGSSTPWQEIGGTSVGAPQWSALVAIAGQGRALQGEQPLDGPSQLLPAIYGLPASDFHDVTSGSSTGNPGYSAGPGYDLVTGLGSPVANLLVADLVNYGSKSAAPTTTTLSAGATPSVYGQPLTLTATVQAGPGAGTPTGTVTFLDGSTVVGTAPLSGGSVTYTTATLATGAHSLSAVYGGRALNFQGSTSATLTQTVNPDATTAVVTSSNSPAVFGQAVTFTATVSADAPGAGTPTGSVTFQDGTTSLGTATLGNGTATYSTLALSVGSHAITVSYGGDANFTAGTSAVWTQVVNQPALATATSLRASVNPSLYMQRVTFTASVKAAAGSGTPTGTVAFLDGTTVLGSAALTKGTASFAALALSPGAHSITASYGGDATYARSTSAASAQMVNQDPTGTSFVISTNPSVYGQSVVFTATVKPGAPGSGTPTGSVTIYDGSTALTTVALANGRASFSTSTLAVGAHAISVGYGGAAGYLGSSSATSSQQVNQDATTSKVSSSSNPSVLGRSVTFTATVRAASPGSGTPTGSVTFLDGGTPLGSATLSGGVATFTATGLAAGSHSITVSYGGDSHFTGGTSVVFSQTVNGTGGTSAGVISAAASVAARGSTPWRDVFSYPQGLVVNGASQTASNLVWQVRLTDPAGRNATNPGVSATLPQPAGADAPGAENVGFGAGTIGRERSDTTTIDRVFTDLGVTLGGERLVL